MRVVPNWRLVVERFVAGEPVPQSRPRVDMRGARAHAYEPERVTDWKRTVAVGMIGRHVELKGPLRCELEFLLPRPQRMRGKRTPEGGPIPHAVRPDLDNLIKAALDGIGQTEIWGDDAQVQEVAASKCYAGTAQRSGVAVRIYESGDE